MIRDLVTAAGGIWHFLGGGTLCAAFLLAIIYGGLIAEAMLTTVPQ